MLVNFNLCAINICHLLWQHKKEFQLWSKIVPFWYLNFALEANVHILNAHAFIFYSLFKIWNLKFLKILCLSQILLTARANDMFYDLTVPFLYRWIKRIVAVVVVRWQCNKINLNAYPALFCNLVTLFTLSTFLICYLVFLVLLFLILPHSLSIVLIFVFSCIFIFYCK